VIVDAINDHECLDQLTMFARELAPTTLIRSVAQRLKTRENVIRWLRSLPQANDDGDESVRFIQCDVPQRARLLPDDPNCVERSLGALMLLEVIDPKTQRALATVDRPMRHTGLVEKVGDHWRAVDLFPRRNARRDFSWDAFGKDALQGTHQYVGKPILKFYLGDTGGQVADRLGEQEDSWIGRDKKKQQPQPAKQQEKKFTPPPAGSQRPGDAKQGGDPKRQPATGRAGTEAQTKPARLNFAQLVGAGAPKGNAVPVGGGGNDGKEEKGSGRPSGAALDGAAARPAQTEERSDRDSHDDGADPQRFWWSLGR